MSQVLPLFKKEFDEQLKEIGIWVLYTRSDRRFRCTRCYSLHTGDAAANCTTCFGTGWHTRLERWKVYPTNAIRFAAPAVTPLTPVGWTAEQTYYVITRAEDIPSIGDSFLLVEWNAQRAQVPSVGQPVRISNILRVTYVEPYLAGGPVYFMAHCDIGDEARHQSEIAVLQTRVSTTRNW